MENTQTNNQGVQPEMEQVDFHRSATGKFYYDFKLKSKELDDEFFKRFDWVRKEMDKRCVIMKIDEIVEKAKAEELDE